MKRFLTSKVGVICLCCFTVLMAVMLQRVVSRSLARAGEGMVAQPSAPEAKPVEKDKPAEEAGGKVQKKPAAQKEKAAPKQEGPAVAEAELQENLAYLDTAKALSSQSRVDRDRQGRSLTRRKTARAQAEVKVAGEDAEPEAVSGSLRLKGRTPSSKEVLQAEVREAQSLDSAEKGGMIGVVVGSGVAPETQRFCPFGRPIKCELVFTLDSTMEETPLVGLVMEPVYNNGLLVIPAGAELHGMARPDRLRDRLFSGQEWVMLFPREEGRPNGRQLKLKGLALDRVEPEASGLSWGITDGSYGLQGVLIRSLKDEEIKRFAATFLSAASFGLQEREESGEGSSKVAATPRNAALQGLGTTLEQIARKIQAEVELHGVFIRVPGGKQFYFYPQQAIFPDLAAVPQPVFKGVSGAGKGGE